MDTEYIKEVIEKDIERLGCKVWGLELFGRRSNQTLRIYIDNIEAVSYTHLTLPTILLV